MRWVPHVLLVFDHVARVAHPRRHSPALAPLPSTYTHSPNTLPFSIPHIRSKALPLAPGEVVFTDPLKTALPMPSGKIAITGFRAEVVDAAGASVPLSEVYNHHWLVYDGRKNSGVCGGYLVYKFGVGAECRGTPTVFPAPYALTAEGTETWGANIHLLRTVVRGSTSNACVCLCVLYVCGCFFFGIARHVF